MPRKRQPPITLTPQEMAHYSAIEEMLSAVLDPIGPRAPARFLKPSQYVYVTRADFGYKIGMTTRPKSRPLSVAGNTPIKLEVVALLEVDDMRKTEAELHSYFAAKRLHGEWFALTDDDVVKIKGYPKSFEQTLDSLDEDVPF